MRIASTRCPKCGADLTELGAVQQDSTEIGTWSAHVREYQDGELDVEFESFATSDTFEVGREAYCSMCDADLFSDAEEVE